MEGYKKALTVSGIKIRQPYIILCNNDPDKSYVLIKNLLKRKARPDGILATVEKLTPAIYLACKSLKLNIPDDLKVVAFSNLLSASILNPSLTTVIQPAFEMGKAAASALFKALEKKNIELENESLILPSRLVIRDSTSHKKNFQ